jgi:uncharacterized protein (TIGR03382 family)
MYALSGALVVDGGAAFADPSCLTPTSSFFLDAGATAGAFFVKALAPATVQLTAAFIDYLPGSATVLAVTPDGGTADAGSADAGSSDAGGTDAGGTDAGSTDAGSTDAGSTDAGSTDAGGTDAGGTDAGGTDAGGTDAGGTDAGDADAGSTDAGVDAGTSDAGDQPGLGGSTRELALGCDCASVDFASAWLGLALAFTLRRWAAKRRHR